MNISGAGEIGQIIGKKGEAKWRSKPRNRSIRVQIFPQEPFVRLFKYKTLDLNILKVNIIQIILSAYKFEPQHSNLLGMCT